MAALHGEGFSCRGLRWEEGTEASRDRREVSLTLKISNHYEPGEARQNQYQKTFRLSPVPLRKLRLPSSGHQIYLKTGGWA